MNSDSNEKDMKIFSRSNSDKVQFFYLLVLRKKSDMNCVGDIVILTNNFINSQTSKEIEST